MLAETAKEPFDDKDWLFELKLDGVRAIAILDGETKLYGRSGSEISRKFPELMAMHKQAQKPCILDGEIVASSLRFEDIQSRIHKEKDLDIRIASKQAPCIYYAFDILFIGERNIMALPLIERKAILHSHFIGDSSARTLGFQTQSGRALFEKIREAGLEGIIAKQISSPYLAGKRSPSWLKIKNFREEIFYICGVTEGEGDRAKSFGSFVLGKQNAERDVLYVGNCGSGFTEAQLMLFLQMFEPMRSECPFRNGANVDRSVKFWVRPEFRCEVRYLELSPDGKLRFPSFRRLIR